MHNNIIKFFKLICFTILIALSINSNAQSNNKLTINNLWARPTSAALQNTAIYMNIENNNDFHDALLKVESNIAYKTTIHKTIYENSVSKMINIDKLIIPAHNIVRLAPGGIHIMLLKVTDKLTNGESFEIKLHFEKSGTIIAKVPVKLVNN